MEINIALPSLPSTIICTVAAFLLMAIVSIVIKQRLTRKPKAKDERRIYSPREEEEEALKKALRHLQDIAKSCTESRGYTPTISLTRWGTSQYLLSIEIPISLGDKVMHVTQRKKINFPNLFPGQDCTHMENIVEAVMLCAQDMFLGDDPIVMEVLRDKRYELVDKIAQRLEIIKTIKISQI